MTKTDRWRLEAWVVMAALLVGGGVLAWRWTAPGIEAEQRQVEQAAGPRDPGPPDHNPAANEARKAIGRAPVPKSEQMDVGAIVWSLSDPDVVVRRNAALALRENGPQSPEVVFALVAARADADEGVRVVATSALGRIGREAQESALARLGPEAVPLLVKTLSNPDADLRQRVADTLGRIGPGAKDAVTALAAALADESVYVRRAASAALGRIGPGAEQAIPALVKLLNDPDINRPHSR